MKTKEIFRRTVSVLLIMLTLLSLIMTVPLQTDAATQSHKKQRVYDIAIVFDNSGSMYDNERWSRAKYAMEIFASMLDYGNGDKLNIFPMWDVTTDGSKPTGNSNTASTQMITVSNVSDINKITNMYTIFPKGTPFDPVNRAHEYLKGSSATDKWIVVLSDGAFSSGLNGSLRDSLIAVATDNISVQYLGFGEASKVDSAPEQRFYAKASTDTSLKDDLVGICNSIFQRIELPAKYISGSSLNLDISMRKVIVFAQGNGAKLNGLKSSSGKSISVSMDSGQRKFSTINAGGNYGNYQYSSAPYDSSLYGQVVTFGACEKGKYTLDCTGAEKVQVFYEPDVDMKVTLKNSSGATFSGPQDVFESGDYTVHAKIVDRITGEDVTNHELLGGVNIKYAVYNSKGEKVASDLKNGDKVTLAADEKTQIVIDGTYLGDYSIRSDESYDLDWLANIKVENPAADFKISASSDQPNGMYKRGEQDSWKPIKVTMALEGRALTEEEHSRVKLEVQNNDDLKCKIERIAGESAYNVYIAQDDAGNYVDPNGDNYDVNFLAVYSDETGKQTRASAGSSVKIVNAIVGISTSVAQPDGLYKKGDYTSWTPIKVALTLDEQPMTDEQLERTELKIASGDLQCRAERIPGSSAFNVYVAQDANGNYIDPTSEEYDIDINATYTDAYGRKTTVSDKAHIKFASVVLSAKADVQQPGDWYKVSENASWKPIKVKLDLDGKPLTDEQLKNATITLSGDENLKYRCEPVFGESAVNVYIGQDADGNYVEPEMKKYKLDVNATYIDENGKQLTATDDAKFEVQWYSAFWKWLIWVLLLLLLIIIILLILNHPSLPSSIYLKTKNTCNPVKINGNIIGLSSNLYQGEIKCEAKACTPFKIKGSQNARFEINKLKPAGSVNWYEIDGYRFKKSGGKYLNDDGETIDNIKPKIQVSDDTELKWNTNRHTVTGRIYINHRD